MPMKNKYTFRNICLYAGIGLLVIAAILMFTWQWNIRTAAQKAEAYIQSLYTLMPEPQSAIPEERKNNTMPVLSLEGTDFAGILEMPRYGSALPVGAVWKTPSKYPCCFSGSVYNGTLQIGATTQKGQYDFYREISVGDTVFYTDMEGNRYTYTVTDIRYEKHADQAALERKDAALTLFIKNIYALEYVIIFCNTAG